MVIGTCEGGLGAGAVLSAGFRRRVVGLVGLRPADCREWQGVLCGCDQPHFKLLSQP